MVVRIGMHSIYLLHHLDWKSCLFDFLNWYRVDLPYGDKELISGTSFAKTSSNHFFDLIRRCYRQQSIVVVKLLPRARVWFPEQLPREWFWVGTGWQDLLGVICWVCAAPIRKIKRPNNCSDSVSHHTVFFLVTNPRKCSERLRKEKQMFSSFILNLSGMVGESA